MLKINTYPMLIGLLVTGVGFVVMIGWIFNIGILKSILPIWVSMKFTTALSFSLSGIILYLIQSMLNGNQEIPSLILPVPVLLIFLLMGTLLISNLLGMRTGIEDLFVQDSADAVKTTVPGRPSLGTLVNFNLIAVAGLMVIYQANRIVILHWLGWVILGIGGIAILGYLLNTPVLYYFIGGWSTAMAFHTALLFVLVGVGMCLLTPGKAA